jgi:hypothetical protein
MSAGIVQFDAYIGRLAGPLPLACVGPAHTELIAGLVFPAVIPIALVSAQPWSRPLT